MIRFYSPDIESSLLLPEGESGHCCRVLRKRIGDEIEVTDGKGSIFRCRISDDRGKCVKLEIFEKKEELTPRPYRVVLAVAPTKSSDRMEWLAEKAVELGVDELVLVRCERSERKVLKPERLEKIMIAAMKQSLGTHLPIVGEMITFKQFIKSFSSDFQKFFGYCSDEYPRKDFVKEYKAGNNVVVMIGPEGDFTPEEANDAVANGYIPVTLGDRRLRTETAALFSAAAINVINQL